MGSLHLGQFKKQASFFLREKFKTARLVLTDVTEAELMTEEATNSDPWGPESRRMAVISRAAFEVDDYWRIVNILHKRLAVLDKKSWRETFKTLVLSEYLLTHGPESLAADFRSEKDVLHQLTQFQHVDDLGFDWGQSIQRKAERILELLNEEKLLKEERNRARRVSRGITGSGSFSSRTSSSPASERSESIFTDIPEEVGASYEEGVNQTREIYPKGFSSPGISTNVITTQDEEFSSGKANIQTINSRSDNVGCPGTKNDNNAYHSNTEWQPFQERNIFASTGQSFIKTDFVNLIRSDEDKYQSPVQANSTPPNTDTSQGFHAYGYRIQSESLVNSSKGKQHSSPTACNGSEIDPFDGIDNDTPTQCLLSNNHKSSKQHSNSTACNGEEIDPFDDIDNDTPTQSLLSNNHKRSPTSILDFHDSAGLAIKI